MNIDPKKVVDLSQDFSWNTPAFAGYAGPEIKWVKHLAFDRAGGQHLSTTLHVSTHFDAPAHFLSGGKGINAYPLDYFIGPACVVDLKKMGVGDYELYGPEHFEQWERDTGNKIEPNDILVIHTGYHRFFPENWRDRSEVDEERYFLRHPGPGRDFAEWILERGVRWIALDVSSADHPMNTVIRRIRPDEAELAEEKLGRSLDEVFPKPDYQIMHTLLFPKDVIHVENLGGDIGRVLDKKVTFGAFPWRFEGGEAAFCRAMAFLD